MQVAHHQSQGAARDLTACRLCKRKPVDDTGFCTFHLEAKKNVESAYKQWDEGFGGMTWEKYLQKIRRNSLTGRWAKEVADLLAKEAAE